MKLFQALVLIVFGYSTLGCKSINDVPRPSVPIYGQAQHTGLITANSINQTVPHKADANKLPISKNLGNYHHFESCEHYSGDVTSITQICTKAVYSANGDFTIISPDKTTTGDLLLLFLSRTDNPLPHQLEGWTPAASCLKSRNGQQNCRQIQECEVQTNHYCMDNHSNGSRKGEDLATVVFYKTREQNDTEFTFALKGNKPAWAILASVQGANNEDPIVGFSNESSDSYKGSVFPSVNANSGQLLLFSMAFDDTANINDFQAPNNSLMYAWVAGEDEAGVLYGQIIENTGASGTHKTHGRGGSRNKDALISIVIRAALQ